MSYNTIIIEPWISLGTVIFKLSLNHISYYAGSRALNFHGTMAFKLSLNHISYYYAGSKIQIALHMHVQCWIVIALTFVEEVILKYVTPS